MKKTPENPLPGGRRSCPGALQGDLKAYLDGELTALRRGLVRWHIARCADCREETVWLRRLGEDMRTLEKSAPSPRLRSRILASLPPPVPMRTPLKIWRPERGIARLAPNLALGAAVGAFALGSAFAVTHRSRSSQNPVAPFPTRITQDVSAPPVETIEKGAPAPPKITPVAAIAPDLFSVKANALYHAAAHRIAMQRKREAQLITQNTNVPKAQQPAPTEYALTPNEEVKDVSSLKKRLEALAIQAGGAMKPVLLSQTKGYRVAPGAPIEGEGRPTASSAEAPATADNTAFAMQIPAKNLRPFLEAMRTLGMLKRAANKNGESVPDQSVARDTTFLEANGAAFAAFQVRLTPR